MTTTKPISLNVGNCWDWDFLDKLIGLNTTFGSETNIKVTSLYGSLPWVSPSARSADRLPEFPYGKDRRGDLRSYIRYSQGNGMIIRYTLNQSCLGPMQEFENYWKELKRGIELLAEMDVHQYTITSPLLMELVKEIYKSSVYLEISTICEVDNTEKLDRWRKIGATGLCLKLDANRDPQILGSVAGYCRAHNMGLDLLANEFCLFGCPWRAECYNLSSHNSIRGPYGFYPFRRCQTVRLEDPSEWIKARFILPQWMRTYESRYGINEFKITGRTHPPEVVLPIVEKYVKGEATGNLLSLWPTISKLGRTEEPQERTYIDIYAIQDELTTVYGPLLSSACSRTVCDGCGHCKQIYEGACVK